MGCQGYGLVSADGKPVLPESNPGATAHVVLDFGGGTTVKIDVTVLRTPGGWFASDTSCTGQDQASSIYAASPPACG